MKPAGTQSAGKELLFRTISHVLSSDILRFSKYEVVKPRIVNSFTQNLLVMGKEKDSNKHIVVLG